ncbi:MAG: glycosyltransferase family 2 protein [Rhodospirillales bacterium]|nr:MAG: glycosyltransferase family 2 protein [Rhodospirillales bacterium]
MTTPSVSIVIPCYNREGFVGQAIQSALDQGPDVEVIVIDDGSTDGSLDVIRSFGDRIVWRAGPNRGACAARNTGLHLANAERVCFLDSDDFYDPGFVSRMLQMSAADTIDVALGQFRSEHSASHSSNSILRPGMSRDQIFRAWSEVRATQTGAILWRRDFVIHIGGWRESLLQYQDIEIGCRAMLLGARAQAVDAGFLVARGPQAIRDRISYTVSESTVQSMLDAVRDLSVLAPKPNEFDQECIGRFAYAIARKAFKNDHRGLGLDALGLARQLGFSGHCGTAVHVLGATLIGLPLKDKLAARLRPSISLVRARSRA